MTSMQGQEWVVDTGVLATTANNQDAQYLNAVGLLNSILSNHHIALDTRSEIQNEYHRNIGNNSYAQRWFQTMISRSDKIMWRDGRLSNRHRNALLNRLSFDRDDLVFVAVASKGISKQLVSKDSDYDEQVNEYMKDELGITTYQIEDALTRAEQ